MGKIKQKFENFYLVLKIFFFILKVKKHQKLPNITSFPLKSEINWPYRNLRKIIKLPGSVLALYKIFKNSISF